jgi:hypothetical protein
MGEETGGRRQLNFQVSRETVDVLGVVCFLEGATISEVLGPVVEKYLAQRAAEAEVQTAIQLRAGYQAAGRAPVSKLGKPKGRPKSLVEQPASEAD